MEINGTEKAKTTVRFSGSLSEGEKTSVASRQEVVKKGLAKLGISCNVNQIPNIAVLGSGGALRAMIALYGTLSELKKYNLLDCITYLAGVSGSTWCLSALYKTENWTEKIELLEKRQCEDLVQNEWDLKAAKAAVMEAARDELYNLTDFWSYFIVHKLLNELDESELSAHRGACESGKNPYPLYAAVDKETYENQNPGTWFEFTPHEAGVPGLGAYVDMKYFGSIFRKGQLKEKKKEKTICYLQGLWGSALGSEKEMLNNVKDAFGVMSSDDTARDASTGTDGQNFSIFSRAFQPVLDLLSNASDEKAGKEHFEQLESILKNYSATKSFEMLKEVHRTWSSSNAETRKKGCMMLGQALEKDFGDTELSEGMERKPSGGEGSYNSIQHFFRNVMRKTYLSLLNWSWGCTNNFLYHCSDIKFPELTNKEVVSLIDAGLAINTAYPLILRPERNVKLILSFDYSAGDPFETIKKAAQYCKDHGIPFPEIDERELQDADNPSDCYIFKGKEVPTVMHFPLFNKVNCPGKIAEYREQFSTFKANYTGEEIKQLLTAAKKNVTNAQQKILEEIKQIACPVSPNA
ncbi:cytosolic phospholipase A2 gamma-like isoform X2 [Tiliqua scincoides]|uniref:cytosolic phospholipase A2 gamma-like isoform X2 n=1 Tax=Tiliqua scincoides TaxID=71010 RepID=UPI003462E2E2